MAAPTREQRRRSDRKRSHVLSRIDHAGAPKRAVRGITKKQFHEILDKASRPIKREVESDQEQS
jgi:hypothetical protein